MKSIYNNIYSARRELDELKKHTNSESAVQYLKNNAPDDILHAKLVYEVLSILDTPVVRQYVEKNYAVILSAENYYSRCIRDILNISGNTERYIHDFENIYKENITRDGSERLLGFLKNETDFYTAPASSMYHNSFKNGLLMHSVNVYHNLVNLYNSPAFNRFGVSYSDETLAIVSLLHDVCKIFNYTEISNPDGTKSYKYRKHEILGHGDHSVFIIQNFISLTYDEANAIRWHMGFTEPGKINDVGESFENNPLAFMLAIADMMATYYDEQTPGR